jgi:tRNA-specific adenosine deaminase 1
MSKANPGEWTVFAAFIATDGMTHHVLSAAIGTKSVGKAKLCPNGCVQADCHAEILARRGMIRALLH